MARPKKSGLSYFPLDTDFFDNDSRIKILKARYRADGIMIYVYLLCEIYKNGYYMEDCTRCNLEIVKSVRGRLMKELLIQVM